MHEGRNITLISFATYTVEALVVTLVDGSALDALQKTLIHVAARKLVHRAVRAADVDV